MLVSEFLNESVTFSLKIFIRVNHRDNRRVDTLILVLGRFFEINRYNDTYIRISERVFVLSRACRLVLIILKYL